MGRVKHSLSSHRGQLTNMEREELFLPVKYTSIDEILRKKRRNNTPIAYGLGPAGDARDMEGGNHASRLSTVSTVYQAIQDSHRNPEGNYVHEERSSEDGTPLLHKKQEMIKSATRQEHTHKRNSHYENAQQNNTTVDF